VREFQRLQRFQRARRVSESDDDEYVPFTPPIITATDVLYARDQRPAPKRTRDQVSDSEPDDEAPAAKVRVTGRAVVAAGGGGGGDPGRGGGRAKAGDYDEEMKPVIVRACAEMRACIYAKCPMPDADQEIHYVKLAWEHANERFGKSYPLTTAIFKIVSLLWSHFLLDLVTEVLSFRSQAAVLKDAVI
jgi:hypothetical protein